MRKIGVIFGLLVSAVMLLTACSQASTDTDSSGSKPVSIQIVSDPDPAVVGDVTLTLLITDNSGAPLEGARVDVGVDHTDMSGMSMSGPATEQDAGQYVITANFSMSGNWKMTVYVRKDGLDYKEEFELKIE